MNDVTNEVGAPCNIILLTNVQVIFIKVYRSLLVWLQMKKSECKGKFCDLAKVRIKRKFILTLIFFFMIANLLTTITKDRNEMSHYHEKCFAGNIASQITEQRTDLRPKIEKCACDPDNFRMYDAT